MKNKIEIHVWPHVVLIKEHGADDTAAYIQTNRADRSHVATLVSALATGLRSGKGKNRRTVKIRSFDREGKEV